MKYKFILLVRVIVKRVLLKINAAWVVWEMSVQPLSFLVALRGCRVRQKREQRLGIGFKTDLSAPGRENELGGLGPPCSSGWTEVIREYLKAEFHLLICRNKLQRPHLRLRRAKAVPVIIVQERAQHADPEGMFRAGITEHLPFDKLKLKVN